jgi:NAD(P)-dependent dehydrogenase (short-subunit alcohol dehydrogenase family)
VDVTDEDSFRRAAEAYGDGPLDILINVAGVYEIALDDRPFTEQSGQDLMIYFQTNVVVS